MFRQRRSETKIRIGHAVAGICIALEGWEHMEHSRLAGVALLLLGLALLLFARFHRRLHRSIVAHHLDSIAFLIEAGVMGIISATYFLRGKHLLPYCYLAVTLAYLALAIGKRGRAAADHSS